MVVVKIESNHDADEAEVEAKAAGETDCGDSWWPWWEVPVWGKGAWEPENSQLEMVELGVEWPEWSSRYLTRKCI